MHDNLWKSLLAEFIGTFTLVFIGSSALALTIAQGGSLLTSAFAFGLALMTIIYIWGSYSGAHVNPAVSFGFAVAGQMNWGLMIGYWIAQLLGAIAAAALVAYLFGSGTLRGTTFASFANFDAWKAVLMEAFLTFFLVITYLFIYRNPLLAIVSGVAIGLVLTFAMFAGGSLSGGAINPAAALGISIFTGNMGSYWVFVVGPLLGALVAALFYKLFTIDFNCCDKVDDCGNKVLDECGKPLKECKRHVVDPCGNPMKDSCGNPIYETYLKHEKVCGHKQETFRHKGKFLKEHGISPEYVKQQLDRTMSDKSLSIKSMSISPRLASQSMNSRFSVQSMGQFSEPMNQMSSRVPTQSMGQFSEPMNSRLASQPLSPRLSSRVPTQSMGQFSEPMSQMNPRLASQPLSPRLSSRVPTQSMGQFSEPMSQLDSRFASQPLSPRLSSRLTPRSNIPELNSRLASQPLSQLSPASRLESQSGQMMQPASRMVTQPVQSIGQSSRLMSTPQSTIQSIAQSVGDTLRIPNLASPVA